MYINIHSTLTRTFQVLGLRLAKLPKSAPGRFVTKYLPSLIYMDVMYVGFAGAKASKNKP